MCDTCGCNQTKTEGTEETKEAEVKEEEKKE